MGTQRAPGNVVRRIQPATSSKSGNLPFLLATSHSPLAPFPMVFLIGPPVTGLEDTAKNLIQPKPFRISTDPHSNRHKTRPLPTRPVKPSRPAIPSRPSRAGGLATNHSPLATSLLIETCGIRKRRNSHRISHIHFSNRDILPLFRAAPATAFLIVNRKIRNRPQVLLNQSLSLFLIVKQPASFRARPFPIFWRLPSPLIGPPVIRIQPNPLKTKGRRHA